MINKSPVYFLPIAALLIILNINCGDDKNDTKKFPQKDTVIVRDTIPELQPEIKYSFLQIEGIKTLEVLKDSFGVEGRYTILSLNRLDTRNLRRKDSLIIPDTILTDFLKYSPFPEHAEILDSIKKIILISRTIQAFSAYEYGRLVKWGPTSTGKKSTPTDTGLYHTNWKAKVTRSTVDSTWILPYAFNIENREGISLHQFDLPGYPASHACARLLMEDAKWIYYWAEQWILTKNEVSVIAYGTPVIIFGNYDFNSIQPWKELANDTHANDITEEELKGFADGYYKKIISRQEVRDSVITAMNAEKDSLVN